MAKSHIKKGDEVVVLSGEDKGQKGRVLEIDLKKYRALVEGRNIASVHTKPNAQYPQGGIIQKEMPIHLSNLALIDSKSGNATRVGRRKDDDGKTVRYAKKNPDQVFK